MFLVTLSSISPILARRDFETRTSLSFAGKHNTLKSSGGNTNKTCSLSNKNHCPKKDIQQKHEELLSMYDCV